MQIEQVALYAPLLPLIGAAIAGLGCRVIPRALAHSVTIIGVAAAFVISYLIFRELATSGQTHNFSVYTWASSGLYRFEIGFLLDNLTAMMMMVVTFVSLMVHIYTIGYMADDPGYNRFFSYLSLFTFSMLMLVMSNNFVQLFFGWEAVGLVSYLLIGFWFKRPTAIFANMKAFLVNRVGDFGFIIGIGLVLAYTGTLDYQDAFRRLQELALFEVNWGLGDWSLLTVITICLFIGAMGKSAQVPLHVWLPDSMEGPTPISALIHAATMVTAGIFMVARMSPLFELSTTTLSLVLIVGAVTGLFMGFLGIVQNDIKRVVAYSTLSQLGYMTVALGASAYSAAIFHLMTHAFFKALLFLAAGSVIIAMHHDQDIRRMGGLSRYMPITWLTSLIGSLALIGTPFFSGFYSKDSIIEAVKLSHTPGSGFAYVAVLLGVFVTAFYSFRMYFLVFHGVERFGQDHSATHSDGHGDAPDDTHHDDHAHGLAPGQKPHETPLVVCLPLVLLAIPSVLIGFLCISPMLFGDFFAKAIYVDSDAHPAMAQLATHFHGASAMALHGLTSLPFYLALAGVVLAWFFYLKRPDIPALIGQRTRRIGHILDNKYYFDWVNEHILAASARLIGKALWRGGDVAVIDGVLIDGSARSVAGFAQWLRRLQSGLVYHYAFAMMLGVLVMLSVWVFWRR